VTTKRERSEMAAALGRQGGKARVKAQTPEQRRESARRAAKARWAKVREAKGGTTQ